MITTKTIKGVRLYSLDPVLFKHWAVKASTTDDGTICIVLFNTLTYDSAVKYFDDEEQAYYYIHYVLI
jgi:hypothetical protein